MQTGDYKPQWTFPEEDLQPAIVQRLGVASDDLLDFTLFKRSYDARKKSSELCFIYTIDLNVKGSRPAAQVRR